MITFKLFPVINMNDNNMNKNDNNFIIQLNNGLKSREKPIIIFQLN